MGCLFKPSHKKIDLNIRLLLILRTVMDSHPEGLDGAKVTAFLSDAFSSSIQMYLHKPAMVLVRKGRCGGLPAPPHFAYVIYTFFISTGEGHLCLWSEVSHQIKYNIISNKKHLYLIFLRMMDKSKYFDALRGHICPLRLHTVKNQRERIKKFYTYKQQFFFFSRTWCKVITFFQLCIVTYVTLWTKYQENCLS